MSEELVEITLDVNGRTWRERVPPRMSLARLLRERMELTGTHLGCEQGVCGSCTVLIDGRSARSCLTLAVQADGRSVTTVEGVARDGELSPVQEALVEHHAFQCGYCTPGFVMLATELVAEAQANGRPAFTRAEIRDRLSANLCRCTGYEPIIDAVEEVLRGRD